MEEKYELLYNVLKELQEKGVLGGLVIVGSWCQYYYRILFDNAPEIPLLRTLDIDFLVPNPSKFKTKVDVPELLNQLGLQGKTLYWIVKPGSTTTTSDTMIPAWENI